MIDPFNASGTTSDNSQQQLPSNLPIRTLRDDLANFQKTGQIKNEVLETEIKTSPDDAEKKSKAQVIPEKNNPNNVPVNLPMSAQKSVPELTEMPLPEKKSLSMFMVSSLTMLILLLLSAIGFGAYSLLKTESETQQAAQEQQPVVIVAPEEKYSLDKPNYLPLDLASLGTDEIWTAINNVADELKNNPAGSNHEFVVVDSNNNPVAFPIFATAAKTGLSPSTLVNLGENFSLFFYNDGENMRLAFSVSAKDKNLAATELANQEASFLKDASLLFLDENIPTATIVFGSSSYNGVPIRYANIDQQKNLSLDYAFFDSTLVIGTSKNAARAVLDKLSGSSTKTTGAASVENETPASLEKEPATEAGDLTDPPRDFLDKFKRCEPATYTDQPDSYTPHVFKIVGPENGRCEITTFYPINPNPKWINQEMTCLYDNSKEFREAVAETDTALTDNSKLNCSGPLFNLMKSPLNQ